MIVDILDILDWDDFVYYCGYVCGITKKGCGLSGYALLYTNSKVLIHKHAIHRIRIFEKLEIHLMSFDINDNSDSPEIIDILHTVSMYSPYMFSIHSPCMTSY